MILQQINHGVIHHIKEKFSYGVTTLSCKIRRSKLYEAFSKSINENVLAHI